MQLSAPGETTVPLCSIFLLLFHQADDGSFNNVTPANALLSLGVHPLPERGGKGDAFDSSSLPWSAPFSFLLVMAGHRSTPRRRGRSSLPSTTSRFHHADTDGSNLCHNPLRVPLFCLLQRHGCTRSQPPECPHPPS